MKLFSFRTDRRAELWFFEPTAFLIILTISAYAYMAVLHWQWWLVLLVGSCWSTRLRVTRSDAATVRRSTYWLCMPIRWTALSIHQLHTDLAQDDVLCVGRHEVGCKEPDRELAWLRASAARLSLPTAKLRT